MQAAIDETNRRRALQVAYNEAHGIVPRTVTRDVVKSISAIQEAIAEASARKRSKKKQQEPTTPEEIKARLVAIEASMQEAADALDFEKAIALRDEWHRLKAELEKV